MMLEIRSHCASVYLGNQEEVRTAEKLVQSSSTALGFLSLGTRSLTW